MEVFTTTGGDAWSTGWRDAHGHALAANAVQLQFEALQEIAAREAGRPESPHALLEQVVALV